MSKSRLSSSVTNLESSALDAACGGAAGFGYGPNGFSHWYGVQGTPIYGATMQEVDAFMQARNAPLEPAGSPFATTGTVHDPLTGTIPVGNITTTRELGNFTNTSVPWEHVFNGQATVYQQLNPDGGIQLNAFGRGEGGFAVPSAATVMPDAPGWFTSAVDATTSAGSAVLQAGSHAVNAATGGWVFQQHIDNVTNEFQVAREQRFGQEDMGGRIAGNWGAFGDPPSSIMTMTSAATASGLPDTTPVDLYGMDNLPTGSNFTGSSGASGVSVPESAGESGEPGPANDPSWGEM